MAMVRRQECDEYRKSLQAFHEGTDGSKELGHAPLSRFGDSMADKRKSGLFSSNNELRHLDDL